MLPIQRRISLSTLLNPIKSRERFWSASGSGSIGIERRSLSASVDSYSPKRFVVAGKRAARSMPRDGTTQVRTFNYGEAIDLNSKVASILQAIETAMKDEGLTWGGTCAA